MTANLWHVLDTGSIWLKEFAVALGKEVPICAWAPVITWNGVMTDSVRRQRSADPALDFWQFPLQRGYARFPLSVCLSIGPRVGRMLASKSAKTSDAVLVCTTPYYAPVAEWWPGPVVYYQTDLTVAYAGANSNQVRKLDERLCRAASLVCPNSNRIANYMVERGCAAEKLVVLPNATRASNLLSRPEDEPGPLPVDVAHLPRPIAGVIGNLAANMDWLYISELIERTPSFSWVLVGPTTMPVPDSSQNAARTRLMMAGQSRVHFTGSRSYSALQSYARSFDVAVLPYRRKEPTYSGSSTRFYEHLAAGRPMIATRGFEELLHQEPLLALADDAQHAAEILVHLERIKFRDGYEQQRWKASQKGTWETRAADMVQALKQRLHSTAETIRSNSPQTKTFAPTPFNLIER